MSIQTAIDEHLNNAWDAGDAMMCLHRAVTTNDPEQARFAALRCYDVARRLERRLQPAHPPAPETAGYEATRLSPGWSVPQSEANMLLTPEILEKMGVQLAAPASDHIPDAGKMVRTPANLIDTPGWQEQLDRAVDGPEADERYELSGRQWRIFRGAVWCLNPRSGYWDQATMTPEQLRESLVTSPDHENPPASDR